MRAHQEAFDIEPTFPMLILEEVVGEIEGTCGVEPSCKVEGDRLFAGRFNVCNDEKTTWPASLQYASKLLNQIENQVGVCINRDLFEKFSALHINSEKIVNNTVGVDLHPETKNSCIKIYIHTEQQEDPEELVRTALALDGVQYSNELIQVLLKDAIAIGFEFFFDGRSNLEFLPCSPGGKHGPQGNWGRYLTPYVRKNFSQKVVSFFEVSDFFYVTIGKSKPEPVLHFGFNKIKDIPKYFLFNSLGDRIYDFCQSQDCITYAVIGVTERNLESNRLEDFYFYYNKRDICQPYEVEYVPSS
jgi:LynF/TruF/PatF family peptide O-prenyltransferase